ncbi:unnamed protein product [Absidia cylindrospora]
MDFVKTRLKQHRHAMAAGLAYRHALVDRQQQLEMDKNAWQQQMIDMKQAQSFWCQFDTQHVQPYLDWLTLHGCDANDDDDRWTRLRQFTMDYEQAQKRGLLHHRSRPIHFMCTQCHDSNHDWPCLDKRTAQLLCTSCYHHYTRKVKASPPADVRQPPSPLLSVPVPVPSSLLTSTAHAFMNDCKPLVKKMKSALALNSKLNLLAQHPLLVSRYLYRSLLP